MPHKFRQMSVSRTLTHSVSQPFSQSGPLEVKILALMALFYIIAVTLYKFIQLRPATCQLKATCVACVTSKRDLCMYAIKAYPSIQIKIGGTRSLRM